MSPCTALEFTSALESRRNLTACTLPCSAAFECDDVIRRAHISRNREQQATAPRGHTDEVLPFYGGGRGGGGGGGGGDEAIHQCPRADSRYEGVF